MITRKKFGKILTAILALTIIIGGVFGVGMIAGAEEGALALEYANVNYGEQISLVFTITGEGDNVGIAVYASEDAKNPMYATNEAKGEEVVYYETFGIAAKDIDTTYYVAVAKFDEDGRFVEAVSERIAYSVAAYATARLADENATDAQKHLYNTILAYGEAANALFGEEINK